MSPSTLDPQLKVCICEPPSERPNRTTHCVRCGHALDPRWVSSDQTVKEFYDALEEGMFPGVTPDWFQTFRLHCEQRERAGRKTFGYRYLARDNPREATEEWADGANYIFFQILQEIRNDLDPQMDLAMQAAYHAAMAYHFTQLMREKERGRPGEYEPPKPPSDNWVEVGP